MLASYLLFGAGKLKLTALRENPLLGERQKFSGSTEAMTLSWHHMCHISNKMLEDSSHSCREGSWNGPVAAFPAGSAHAYHSLSPGRHQAGRTDGHTSCSECALWLHNDQEPLLSPQLPQCTHALFLVTRVCPPSISLGVINSLQAVTSPSFLGTEVIN